MRFLIVFLFFVINSIPLFAIGVNRFLPKNIPGEIKPFIEKGERIIALGKADLNGDSHKDYLLILEKIYPADLKEGQRPLLILIRQPSGKLTVEKRNEKIIYCSTCGGLFGDPFEGIQAGYKTFTINHYGGSAWRWHKSYKFNYSKRDKTWQVVRITETSYHTSNSEKAETSIFTPPKDYGKIDIADFDPEDWKDQGPR